MKCSKCGAEMDYIGAPINTWSCGNLNCAAQAHNDIVNEEHTLEDLCRKLTEKVGYSTTIVGLDENGDPKTQRSAVLGGAFIMDEEAANLLAEIEKKVRYD